MIINLAFAAFLLCTQHKRGRAKTWLAWNQDNVFEYSNMSACGPLFQWASTIKIQLSV